MSRFVLGNCIDVMARIPDNAIDFMSGSSCTLLVSASFKPSFASFSCFRY
ncbi:hypothetical protein JNB34_18820 [Escherichia coli]|nr:hypothetical protein [Escherichia coli]MBL6408743.1 hypothetical protein [Escherichia coli]